VPEPHPGWGKLPDKLSGPFPGAPRFTVRGYAYRYQGDLGLAVPGCAPARKSYQDGDGPLAEDGSLCPSVGWPGAVLTDAQATRLVTLVRGRDTTGERMPMRCAFDPHHAFVFFGESGAPVATLLVCFKCNQWRTHPAQPGLDVTLSDKARDVLSAVCREAGLGACGHDTPTLERIAAERSRWHAHKGSHNDFDLGDHEAIGPRERFLEAASGVAPDKRIRCTDPVLVGLSVRPHDRGRDDRGEVDGAGDGVAGEWTDGRGLM